MAQITVDIPGYGPVDFPDTMSPEDVNATAKRLYTEAQYAANDKAANTPHTPETATQTFQAFREGTYKPGIMGAPLVGSQGIANAAGAALKHPMVEGALLGGLEGAVNKGDLKGVATHAAMGAVGGGVLNKVLGAVRGLGTAATAAKAVAPEVTTAGRLVLGPAEAAAQDQLRRMAAQQASKVGMAHAAGGTLRDELLKLLGR